MDHSGQSVTAPLPNNFSGKNKGIFWPDGPCRQPSSQIGRAWLAELLSNRKVKEQILISRIGEMAKRTLILTWLFISLTLGGCSNSRHDWESLIQEAASTDPTTDEETLEKHKTKIMTALNAELKRASSEQVTEIGKAYTAFLLEDFNVTYNQRTIAPPESARFQASLTAGIRLFRDKAPEWGDRTFRQLIPDEAQFSEWMPSESKNFAMALNYLKGLSSAKNSMLNESGAAVSDESLELLLKRVITLTFECQSETNQLALANAVFSDWAQDLPLVRSHLKEMMEESNSFIAAEIFEKYGNAFDLPKPLGTYKNVLQTAAQRGNLEELFSASEDYMVRCKNIGVDPMPILEKAFAGAFERPLSRLDKDPEEILAIYSTAKRLDQNLLDKLAAQLDNAISTKLELVLDSGDIDRIRSFITAVAKVDVSERTLVQKYLPSLAFGESPAEMAKTIAFLKAMSPGPSRARLIIDLLGQNRLDVMRLESLVTMDLQNEEVAEILPFLRQLPIDKDPRFKAVDVLSLVAKIESPKLRQLLIESTMSALSGLQLQHLLVLADAELTSEESEAILRSLEGATFQTDSSEFFRRDFLQLVGRFKNPTIANMLIRKAVVLFELTFAEIDQLVELEPKDLAAGELANEASEAIAKAIENGDSASEVRRFYEKNMKGLNLVSTPDIAQACFDDALINGQIPVIRRHVAQLVLHKSCQNAENATRLWSSIAKEIPTIAVSGKKWDDELVDLIALNARLDTKTKDVIKQSLLDLLKTDPLDDLAIVNLCNEIARTDLFTNKELALAEIKTFGLCDEAEVPDLNLVSRVRDQLELLYQQFGSDVDAISAIDPITQSYKKYVAALARSGSATRQDLLQVFDLASDKKYGDPGLLLPLSERILAVDDLENSLEVLEDVSRYLKLAPEQHDHLGTSLQRLFRMSIDKKSWLEAEKYIDLLRAKQSLTATETKLRESLEEAIHASKLASRWKGRMIPFTVILTKNGVRSQNKQSLVIKEIKGNALTGTIEEHFGSVMSEFTGEIGLDGLSFTFEESRGNGMPKSTVRLSRTERSEDPSAVDFAGLEKECPIYLLKGRDYDLYVADIPQNIEFLYCRNLGEPNWGFFSPPFINLKSQYLFHPIAKLEGVGRQVPEFDISDLCKGQEIELRGRIYLDKGVVAREGVNFFIDNNTNPLKSYDLSSSFPGPNRKLIEQEISLKVPAGSRKLVISLFSETDELMKSHSNGQAMWISGFRAIRKESSSSSQSDAETENVSNVRVFQLVGRGKQGTYAYDTEIRVSISGSVFEGRQTLRNPDGSTLTIDAKGSYRDGKVEAKVYRGAEEWTRWSGSFDMNTGNLDLEFFPLNPKANPTPGTLSLFLKK